MNNKIPIIESEKGGYWEIYPDRKIWHKEESMKFKDYDSIPKKYGIGGGDWMKLQEGDNKIRIVSEFEDYGTHYNPTTKKSIVCLGKEKCEVCLSDPDNKPRVQFLGWVIDRKDNKIKLLRIGFKAHKQIGELAKSEDYGFDEVPEYDVTIKKTGQGLDTDYSVLPARQNTSLTEEEEQAVSEKVKKSPKEIIEKMKAKISQKEPIIAGSESEEEEINPENIPF